MQFGDIRKSFDAAGFKLDIGEVTICTYTKWQYLYVHEVLRQWTQATWKAWNLSALLYEPKLVMPIGLEEYRHETYRL